MHKLFFRNPYIYGPMPVFILHKTTQLHKLASSENDQASHAPRACQVLAKSGLIRVHLRSSVAIFISWGDRAMAVKNFRFEIWTLPYLTTGTHMHKLFFQNPAERVHMIPRSPGIQQFAFICSPFAHPAQNLHNPAQIGFVSKSVPPT